MVARKYVYADFRNEKLVPVNANTTQAVATGADNQVDYMHVRNQLFDWIQTGQNDAIVPVLRTAAPLGWALPMDANVTDSIEFGVGGLVDATNPMIQFTVGTDPAFFVRARMSFLNNVDDFAAAVVGFRDVAAQVDVTSAADLLTSYTNTVYLGIAANDGTISSQTQKGATTASTNSTFGATSAAATSPLGINLTVLVSATGVVTYQINGAADTLLAATTYTFTNATAVVPCIHYVSRNGTGNAASELVLQEFECGWQ